MKVIEEMIERGARALLALHGGQEAVANWPQIAPHIRKRWQTRARAVLEAAGTLTAVHLCDTCAQSMCRRRRDIEDACEDPLFPARAVVVGCEAYVADKRVEEVLSSAGEGA